MAVSSAGTVANTEVAYGNVTQVTDAEVAEVAVTNTEAVVREYFSDIPVMIQVARCESTFRHTQADGTVLRGKVDGRDTGVMQINTFYHGKKAEELGLDLEDLHDNMAYARSLYEKQGTQPWSASAHCWNNSLALL